MIAPAFERYFIKATRQAMPQINDPTVKIDADLFCQQEAQHSKHHLAHLKLLTNKHPGLEQTRRAILDSYENLFATQSMAFHLSYAATIELTFGPFAQFVIENRQPLFHGSDQRIASFILWHLVEEFEHRNSAINIYNDVIGSHSYRLKSTVAVVRHLMEINRLAEDGINQHVPAETSQARAGDTKDMFKDIPRRRQLRLLGQLLSTLPPNHNPDHVHQPDWVSQWFSDEAEGIDMTRYYP